jgi:hypothetical protein
MWFEQVGMFARCGNVLFAPDEGQLASTLGCLNSRSGPLKHYSFSSDTEYAFERCTGMTELPRVYRKRPPVGHDGRVPHSIRRFWALRGQGVVSVFDSNSPAS